MAPSSLQVYESYGLILLFMILAFNEVNDFVAASEHSNINGPNGILAEYRDWLTVSKQV